jgi:predicted nucleotidyltransferase component of viral defense system
MIAEKFVDLYSRNSGLRDKLVAERDVVLTYALHALHEDGVMDHLAFKGGTCLRKVVFGSAGRFSEDLDFTIASAKPEDDILVRLAASFNRDHHGIAFALKDFYKTDDGASFGGDVHYRHEWNDSGRFRLQVSLRERPTLPVNALPMLAQGFFSQLEFEPFPVRSLAVVELASEKVRAAYQRVKVRDLYDLHRLASVTFDGDLLRRLAVLKLWQVRDPFSPDAFFARIRDGSYEWEELARLLRANDRPEAEVVLGSVESRFAGLRNLTGLERAVIADAKGGRNKPLAGRLRAAILAIHADTNG